MSSDMSWGGRLASQHPRVAAALADLALDRQIAVAVEAAQLASHMTGLRRPAGSRTDLESQVAELDEKAWDLHDANSAHYPQAFATARAANAWLYLTGAQPEPAEALYEALAASAVKPPSLNS